MRGCYECWGSNSQAESGEQFAGYNFIDDETEEESVGEYRILSETDSDNVDIGVAYAGLVVYNANTFEEYLSNSVYLNENHPCYDV